MGTILDEQPPPVATDDDGIDVDETHANGEIDTAKPKEIIKLN